MSGFSFPNNPSSTTPFSAFSSSSASSPSPFTFASSSSPSSTPVFPLSPGPSASSSSTPSLFGASQLSSSSSSPFSFSFNSSASPSASSLFTNPISSFGVPSSSSSTPSFGSALANSSSAPFSSAASVASVPSFSFGFGSSTSAGTTTSAPLFGTSSASSSPFGTSTLFGASSSTSVSGSASTLFASSSVSSNTSNSVSTGTGATTPSISSNLFGSSSSSFSSSPSGLSSSSSASTAPSFSNLFGSSSSSSSSSSASPFSASLTPAFSLTSGSSSSSASSSPFLASSTPALSFPGGSSASLASSLPFSASSAPAFSFPAGSAFSKLTGSSASTSISSSTSFVTSSSSGSSSFSFAPPSSGFQSSFGFGNAASSAASAATVSSVQAAKPASIGFGTASSSLFSTVTTTTSASSPASTAASSAASTTTSTLTLAFPAFGASSSSSTASSAAATGTSASSAATVSFPSLGATSTPASSGTTSSFPSFSLSTKTTAPVSSFQPQSTAAAPLFGAPFTFGGSCSGCSAISLKVGLGEEEERAQGETEQGRDWVTVQLLVHPAESEATEEELPGVGQDEGENRGAISLTTSLASVDLATVTGQARDWVTVQLLVHPAESEAKEEELPGVGQDEGENRGAIALTTSLASVDLATVTGQARDWVTVQLLVHPAESEAEEEELPGLGQDEGENRGAIALTTSLASVDLATATGVFVAPTVTVEPALEATVVTTKAQGGKSAAAGKVGVTPPCKKVEIGPEEPPANASSVASETDVEDETGAPGAGCQASRPLSLCLHECLFPPQNDMIIKEILSKYGDITVGSMLKSAVAKSTILKLVADAVHRLCNHTLHTLDADELQLIQTHTADAVAVGFHVDWLQQRVNEVIAASQYQIRLMELDKLDQQIDAAKKSLMEMELRQMIWKKEVAAVGAQMGNGFGGSSLGEGLL